MPPLPGADDIETVADAAANWWSTATPTDKQSNQGKIAYFCMAMRAIVLRRRFLLQQRSDSIAVIQAAATRDMANNARLAVRLLQLNGSGTEQDAVEHLGLQPAAVAYAAITGEVLPS